jgi:hypothetical protein
MDFVRGTGATDIKLGTGTARLEIESRTRGAY